jgi:hypothetical protein
VFPPAFCKGEKADTKIGWSRTYCVAEVYGLIIAWRKVEALFPVREEV